MSYQVHRLAHSRQCCQGGFSCSCRVLDDLLSSGKKTPFGKLNIPTLQRVFDCLIEFYPTRYGPLNLSANGTLTSGQFRLKKVVYVSTGMSTMYACIHESGSVSLYCQNFPPITFHQVYPSKVAHSSDAVFVLTVFGDVIKLGECERKIVDTGVSDIVESCGQVCFIKE
jgi:hypothetical protein